MDMFSDNFISYNNDFDVKLEKSSDHDISLDSTSLGTCDTTPCLFPSPFSPSLQNLLNSHEGLTLTDNQFDFKRRNKKPFIIIKTKYGGEPSNTDFEVKVESEDRLLVKNKLIMKREKAKQRAKSKLDAPILTKLESSVCLEDIDTSEADPKTKKKIIQMIRNRISAQNSRDRKKAYLSKLEDSKNQLYAETMKSNQEKTFLLNEIMRVKEQNLRLSQENQKLRSCGSEGSESLGHFCPSDSEIKSQSVEELAQQIIKKSDPATSELLSKNKGLFKNTFSFALSLSILLLAKMGQSNLTGNSEASLEKIMQKLRGEHFLEDARHKEGSYAAHQTPSHIEVEESIIQSDNSDDYTGKQSLINFNTIFQHLVEATKMNETSSNMVEEFEDNDFLRKSLKQEDQELKSHQYNQFLKSRNGSLGLQTNNFLNLNLDEGEDKYSLKF